ncbi:hypothetical protein EVB51_044 [Rhizobium phage RHph_Y17]|uniref:Tail fiber protein n=2 Tax=Kleczkowskavirus RHEph4 TaxID=1921526 RepID=A0A7S5QWY5_9CAUD|nr:hypothetical protein EVB51_044 [Rhizobium phage RHph_Y17]QIG68980.1 hypothetical protein EVB73_044 [Rhizobium phage RHph_Y3_43]
MVDVKQRIDQLPTTLLPSLQHAFPAMKDGLTVQLKVQQIIDLLVNGAPTALDTWLELVDAIEDDQSAIAGINTALANRLRFDAAQALTALQKAQAITNLGASNLSPDFIQGMLLSNDGGNPNTHINVATGFCKSGGILLTNNATLTKRLDQAWAAGTGSGGLDTGTKANNTTYFLYALQKASDGSFDWVYSTSATVAGVNTALLTGYTVVMCLGVVITDASGNIRQFIMYPNDEYSWATPARDLTNTTTGTAGALIPLSVPNGVKVKANLRFMYSSGATTASCLLHDPALGSLIAGGNDSGANVGTSQTASGLSIGADEIWTNTSRQVRHVAGATGNLWVWTDGFIFPCKRNG